MDNFSVRLVCTSLFLILFTAPGIPAQNANATPAGSGSDAVFENMNVRVVRNGVAPGQMLTLPVLKYESLLVIVSGETNEAWSAEHSASLARLGAGEVNWMRRDEQNFVRNAGEQPSSVLVIEFKNSYDVNQLQVPGSYREPTNYDTKNFHPLLENQHARVFLLQVDPLQATEEVQLALTLEIPLRNGALNVFTPDGKFHEEPKKAGDLEWHKNRLVSFSNRGKDSMKEILVELRHPFCVGKLPPGFVSPEDNSAMGTYVRDAHHKLQKNWYKHMPGTVKMGEDMGFLTYQIAIKPDGSIDEDETYLTQIFASNKLVEAARRAVRESAPFRPLPSFYEKPELPVRYSFFYNLKTETAPGCEE
jgi:hypothetical protein